jgi:hypothetical protein
MNFQCIKKPLHKNEEAFLYNQIIFLQLIDLNCKFRF